LKRGREPSATVIVKLPEEERAARLYALRGETRAAVSGRPGSFLLAADPSGDLQSAFQKATTPLSPTPVPGKKK